MPIKQRCNSFKTLYLGLCTAKKTCLFKASKWMIEFVFISGKQTTELTWSHLYLYWSSYSKATEIHSLNSIVHSLCKPILANGSQPFNNKIFLRYINCIVLVIPITSTSSSKKHLVPPLGGCWVQYYSGPRGPLHSRMQATGQRTPLIHSYRNRYVQFPGGAGHCGRKHRKGSGVVLGM